MVLYKLRISAIFRGSQGPQNHVFYGTFAVLICYFDSERPSQETRPELGTIILVGARGGLSLGKPVLAVK